MLVYKNWHFYNLKNFAIHGSSSNCFDFYGFCGCFQSWLYLGIIKPKLDPSWHLITMRDSEILSMREGIIKLRTWKYYTERFQTSWNRVVLRMNPTKKKKEIEKIENMKKRNETIIRKKTACKQNLTKMDWKFTFVEWDFIKL